MENQQKNEETKSKAVELLEKVIKSNERSVVIFPKNKNI